jgi:hypothetical protein
MDSDMKWIIALMTSFIVLPLLGLGVSDWRKQDCRVELAKVGKSIEEIKEICK